MIDVRKMTYTGLLSSVHQRILATARWCRARPWRSAAIVVSGCAIAVATVVMTPNNSTKEMALVDDYLSALRHKDAQKAIDIADAGHSGRSYDMDSSNTPSDALLTDEAVGTDWDYHTVEIGSQTKMDDVLTTTVYATLTHGKQEALSRFDVMEQREEMWLSRPYAVVNLHDLQADPVTIDEATETVTDSGDGLVFAFPGAHQILADSTVHTIDGSADVLWVPGDSNPPLPMATVRDEVATSAQEAFEARLDECAESTQLSPKACPFGVLPHRLNTAADFDADEDFGKVSWEVDTYPRLEFRSTGVRDFEDRAPHMKATVVEYGYLTVSASTPEPFEAECAFTADLIVRVPEPDEFQFFADPLEYNDCVDYR